MSMPIQVVDSQSIYASDPFAIASDVNVNNSIEVKKLARGSNSMDLDQHPFSKSINLGTFHNNLGGLTASFDTQNQLFNRNSDGLDQQKNKQQQFNVAQTINSGSTLSLGYQNQVIDVFNDALPFPEEP